MAPAALITGASSGLGAELAKLFARDKHDVVLVARRKDRLEALAAELQSAHGVRAEVIPADLQDPNGAAAVVAAVAQRGIEVEWLVNNAGFGALGPLWKLDANQARGEVLVNVLALHELTHALVPAMVKRGRGRILNIGSTAGFQPGPMMATYYATKAFVNHFTEALAYELKGTGVTATVSCPGPTLTEFGEVAGSKSSLLFKTFVMGAPEVALQAYRAMMAGRAMIVHGFFNWLGTFLIRFMPRSLARFFAAQANKSTQ